MRSRIRAGIATRPHSDAILRFWLCVGDSSFRPSAPGFQTLQALPRAARVRATFSSQLMRPDATHPERLGQ